MYQEVVIDHYGTKLQGHISAVDNSRGWVIFAHGSGSSRKSARNNWVAGKLNERGFSTLLFDLLTVKEDAIYENRFNIPLLGERLISATKWLMKSESYHREPIAYFGASTGAGAALIAAAKADTTWPLLTIISRGGRPDLAPKDSLNAVSLPVLLIVGGLDHQVLKLNQVAAAQLKSSNLVLVPGATHLFEEPGTLDQVVHYATDWLENLLERPFQEESWSQV